MQGGKKGGDELSGSAEMKPTTYAVVYTRVTLLHSHHHARRDRERQRQGYRGKANRAKVCVPMCV